MLSEMRREITMNHCGQLSDRLLRKRPHWHCNLMVEGPADQILLAGAATHLRSKGASDLETLDLNKITIVPAVAKVMFLISSTSHADGTLKNRL